MLINYSKINWNEVRMLQLTTLAGMECWDSNMAAPAYTDSGLDSSGKILLTVSVEHFASFVVVAL